MTNKVNVKLFESRAKRLKETKAGNPDLYEKMLASWEGPALGVDYLEDEGKFVIAHGWHADENGDVVRD